MIGPDESTFAGQDAFRFRHILIRDAAYESVPKATRAHLHERLAGRIKRAVGERIGEYEEIVGYHRFSSWGGQDLNLRPTDYESAALTD